MTEGHPDKLCDQISDGVLDAMLRDDPLARVACEAATTTGLILVAGEITTSTWVDIPEIVRETVRKAGYTDARFGFDYRTCGVVTAIGKQSPDIDMGVSASVEYRDRLATGALSDTELDAIGAGDQGMMIGFACNETPELMPTPISLAHKLTRRLSETRRVAWDNGGPMKYLRPDGKSQVTVQYEHGKPVRVDTVVISTQHSDDVTQEQIAADVREHIITPTIPAEMLDANTKYLHQPDRALRRRRPDGRRRADRPQDHRRHLRRHGAPRRRSLQRQGPDKGGPLGGVCGALRGEEHRRGGAGGSHRVAGLVRDRRRAAALALRRDVRHGQDLR